MSQKNTELNAAYGLAQKGDYEKAIAICDAFVTKHQEQLEGYRERASIFLHKGDVKSALSDLWKLTELDSQEPSDYFDLGRTLLAEVDYAGSVEALTRAIDLSTKYRSAYYTDTCLLLRALAYLELKKRNEASKDLAQLPSDAAFHVRGRGMVLKADLERRLR